MKPTIDAEALGRVVAGYPALGAFQAVTRNGLSINTPACLFETAHGVYFAKRFDAALWSEADLTVEHDLVARLRASGVPTPQVHRNRDGRSVSWEGGAAYVLYDRARGEDRYGDVGVFEPFQTREEAQSAGAMLARFHRAFAGIPLPPVKPFRGLSARYELMGGGAIAEGFEHLLDEAPILRPFLAGRAELPWLLSRMEGYRTALAPRLAGLPRGIIHGDFIKRNLFYDGPRVSEVIDFDLWNVGYWVYDLALALLPVSFNWPRLLAGEGSPNHADRQAFLTGYCAGRDVSPAELEVLPLVMESARFEFYLSAMATMLGRGDVPEAEKFWSLLVRVFQWFEAHPDWRR